MGSSHGFGSTPCDNRPIQARVRYGSGWYCLNHATEGNSSGHTPKGTLSHHKDAPTAWKHTISGSLSLPSPGYFSPFPHGTVRYRSLGVGSLGGWSPQLPTRFFVPGSTQEQAPRVSSFHYPAITVFGCVFQTPSCHLIQNVCSSADERCLPYNPNHATAAALARDWFGQNPVRSPLLRVFFLFLGLR